jgi:alkanesulfonate monooxygenase SsuD/methylene tetrahydromethanopterin reductase-like flavin-dependent oxidoreductase (luciferase family)
MPRRCLIGVQLPEVERRVEWPELFAMARTAEAVGFDSIWLGDHLLYDLPGGITRDRGRSGRRWPRWPPSPNVST